MRRVVSVSLGSSKRDKVHECTILGQEFRIERRGTDGDKERFKELMGELDGHVDALGIGGADLTVRVGDRTYMFMEIARLVEGVKTTPIVDGSGLKHTLERKAIIDLGHSGIVDWPNEHALLVSGVDRFGMAEALAEVCPHVVYGDLMFGIGLPVPIRSYRALDRLARLILPVVTRLPLSWFYPTGAKQEQRSPKFPWAFDEASVICGDWHFIRRYAPARLEGKTILTQTLRSADLDLLSEAGVRHAVTTTPVMGGETFATNVMEGVLLTLIGKPPGTVVANDYLDMLGQLQWKPEVIDLRARASLK